MNPTVMRLSRRGRERRDVAISLKSVTETGEFWGYASLFGVVDQSKDRVAKGAFRRTLRAHPPSRIKLLYQHLAHEPIGVWNDIHEDSRGLFVRGRLLRDLERARDVHALMKAGAIDGLSIGFRTVRGETDARTGVRTILDLDLWEISVVTFPMLSDARVLAVKAKLRGPE